MLGADGAALRTLDTPALREHFGSGNTGTDRQTPFPMMRLVALMNVRSLVMLDATLSPDRRSEVRLADAFIDRIPDHSISLLDRRFWSADRLLHLTGSGQQRHGLIPARKDLVSETVQTYQANDQLLRMTVSPQTRKRIPERPAVREVRAVSYLHKGKRRTALYPARLSYGCTASAGSSNWAFGASPLQHIAVTLSSTPVELIYQKVWAST